MVLCQPNIQITRTTSFRRASNAKPPLHHATSPKKLVFVSTTVVFSNERSNASGLTPDQTRALPERIVDPDGPEARIIRSLRELYSTKAQNVRHSSSKPRPHFLPWRAFLPLPHTPG